MGRREHISACQMAIVDGTVLQTWWVAWQGLMAVTVHMVEMGSACLHCCWICFQGVAFAVHWLTCEHWTADFYKCKFKG